MEEEICRLRGRYQFLKILIFLAKRELDSEKHGKLRIVGVGISFGESGGRGNFGTGIDTERNWWIRGNTAGRT